MIADLYYTKVPWTNDYTYTRMFTSDDERDTYFVKSQGFYTNNINFKMNNALETRVTIRFDQKITELSVYNYNYIVVEPHDSLFEEKLYYFITDINYDNDIQYIISLELDVTTTYYKMLRYPNAEIFCRRCLYNRWDIVGTRVHFETMKPWSIKTEGVTSNKFLTVQKPIGVYNNIGMPDSVVWEYYILAPDVYNDNGSTTASVYRNTPTNTPSYLLNGGLVQPYTVLAFPILENMQATAVYNGKRYSFYSDTFFKNSVIKSDKILSKVISKYCLFSPKLITKYQNGEFTITSDGANAPFISGGMVAINISRETGFIAATDSNIVLIPDFDIADIKENSEAMALNPKLYLPDVVECSISDGITDRTYPVFGLTHSSNGKFQISYIKSVLSPDSIRVKIAPTIEPNKNPYFNYNIESEYYNAANFNQPSQVTYSREQLDIFLGNNKNFKANLTSTSALNLLSTAAYSATAVATGNPIGVLAAANSALSTAKQAINAGFSYDNLANAPEQINSATNSAEYNFSIMGGGCVQKVAEIPYSNQVALNDYCNKYGYSTDSIMRLFEAVVNRVLYDYVEGDLISMPLLSIPTFARKKFAEILHHGIRLWHVDEVEVYGKSNYEVMLDA